MAERKYTHGMQLQQDDGVTIVTLGDMEIWDGADLSLLRDTLSSLTGKQRKKAIGIDMTSVKYVPSGFFGLLCDCHDRGVSVRLYSPQSRVTQMLWFRKFFLPENDNTFRLFEGYDLGETEDDQLWDAEVENDSDYYECNDDRMLQSAVL